MFINQICGARNRLPQSCGAQKLITTQSYMVRTEPQIHFTVVYFLCATCGGKSGWKVWEIRWPVGGTMAEKWAGLRSI